MAWSTESDTEFAVLTTDEGRALLVDVAACQAARPVDLARWRKRHSVDLVEAALRLAQARRKGRGKFADAEALWLTPTGAEQATAALVADHKAARFARSCGGDVVDLCCGVGGDTIALALAGMRVMAVDRDADMARRVAFNARAMGVSDRVLAVRADAESFPIPRGARVHIDPDRRAGGDRRARVLAGYAPGPEFLGRLMTSTRGGAIKLGPASDFEGLADHARVPVEIELISLHGECKEATLWYGDLAGSATRRATCLPDGESLAGTPDHAPPCPIAESVQRWVYDPDPALTRAGLVAMLAKHHGLMRVLPGCDYLTAPKRIETPWLAAYEVTTVLPLDRKRIRRALQEAEVGPLDVKIRNVALTPEIVRSWAKLRAGGRAATLFLCGSRQATCAILARRAPRA